MARLKEKYGFLAEFKIRLPKDPLYFFEKMASINQYDNAQEGWKKKPEVYDIALFLHSRYLRRAKTFLNKTQQADQTFIMEDENK